MKLTALAALLVPFVLFSCQSSDVRHHHHDHATSSSTYSTVHGAKASAELVPIGGSGVTGRVEFVRIGTGVHVSGRVEGLSPGLHGFHVHEHGDLSDRDEGTSAGGHYAPNGHRHGHPTDGERHVGDLGNILADAYGVADIDFIDSVIELAGDHSIVGRSLVIHAKPDTFGGEAGEAGARVAFGRIVAADAK